MYVLYADELFLENLIVDYILLIVTAKLSGIGARRMRIITAALLGAIYALLAALSGIGFFVSWAVKLSVGAAMVMIVFGVTDKLLRVCLIFFGVSAAFAGAILAASIVRGDAVGGAALGHVDFGSLILAFAVFYVLFAAVFRAIVKHRIDGEVERLTVTNSGKRTVIEALLDTGNGLSEPVSGLPVAVCSLEALRPVLDGRVFGILSSVREPTQALERLCDAGIYSFLLVPYRAVGVSGGMLLAFRPEGMRIGNRELTGFLAVAPNGVGEGAGYSAIVGV